MSSLLDTKKAELEMETLSAKELRSKVVFMRINSRVSAALPTASRSDKENSST